MNLLLTDLLSLDCIEYLIINQDFQILSMSSQIPKFADVAEEVKEGYDIRIGFPELTGRYFYRNFTRGGKKLCNKGYKSSRYLY